MKARLGACCLVIVSLLFIFSACSGGSGASTVPSATAPSTAPPTVAPFPTVALLPTVPPLPTVALQPTIPPPLAGPTLAGAGNVFFQDDFSDPASGWQAEQTDCCQFEYDNGGYRISVPKANTVAFSLFPKQTYSDVRIEVDVAESKGPASAIYGLACRVSSTFDKGYVFAIRPDTAHVIFMVTGSAQESELKAELKSPAILPGNATNHLRADCSGSRLTFYANGQKLIEADDSQYQNGQVGMVVSTQADSGGADISFDNFVAAEAAP